MIEGTFHSVFHMEIKSAVQNSSLYHLNNIQNCSKGVAIVNSTVEILIPQLLLNLKASLKDNYSSFLIFSSNTHILLFSCGKQYRDVCNKIKDHQ